MDRKINLLNLKEVTDIHYCNYGGLLYTPLMRI